MTIPNEKHPGWMDAIAGQTLDNFEFFGTKILLGRLNLVYYRNPSPLTAKKCVAELRSFFEKNINRPTVRADLDKIFTGGL